MATHPECERLGRPDLALRTLDLDDPAKGLRFNWTIAKAGGTLNVIPDEATMDADMRYARNEDMKNTVTVLNERAGKKRLAQSQIEISVDVGRPAFVAGDQGKRLIEKAQANRSAMSKVCAGTNLTCLAKTLAGNCVTASLYLSAAWL